MNDWKDHGDRPAQPARIATTSTTGEVHDTDEAAAANRITVRAYQAGQAILDEIHRRVRKPVGQLRSRRVRTKQYLKLMD